VPKVSQAHLDARKAEILEGARRAFAQHGYDGATVSRLEEETGLSRGAIFHYFDGKLDLFATLANSDNVRYQALLAEEGLEALIRAIAAADPDWLNVLIETEVKLLHDPEFQKRITSTPEQRQTIVGAFERGQASGEFRDDVRADDLARFTSIVINGLALAVSSGSPVDVDALHTLVQDAVRPRD
jgi:TetR/AcrR family transcriptional regulator, transcriptional repressor of aconitase